MNNNNSSPAERPISGEETLIPPRLLQTDIDYDKSVNFALQQNNIPFIRRIRVHNTGEKTWWNVNLQITSDPQFFDPFGLVITRIAPGETITLHSIPVMLSFTYFSEVISPINGSITITISHEESSIGKAQYPIRILPYDQWSGLSSLPELITAYVIPNHSFTQSILRASSSHLNRWTGDSSITGYQMRDRKRIHLITAAIFYAIQELKIRYATTETGFELIGQKIRLPDKLHQNRIGNCLDISLLFAGCLEAAGLNPLLLITQNHAFTGVWLIDETFSDVFVDDILPIKKRIDLDEICIFDPISVTSDSQFSFEEAITSGNHLLNTEKQFFGCIDVKTARSGRYHIIPIPCSTDKSEEDVPEPETNSADTIRVAIPEGPDVYPIPFDTTGTPDKKIHPTIDRWMRSLLDLTLKNHLLHFPKHGIAIPLDIPDIDRLEDLFASGKSFSIKPRYQRDKRGLESEFEFNNQISDYLSDELNKGRIYADLSEKDLIKKILSLYKQARRSLEESGAETLYLALGMMQWFERDSPAPLFAPIILIPLKIVKNSTGTGFTIKQGDDEPRINETLLERLKIDYNLEVPNISPIPFNGDSLEVNEIITRFRMAIRDLETWDVTSSAYISHFSFSKFLMWRDLFTSSDILTDHPFVAYLTDPVNHPLPDCDAALKHPDDISPDELFCPMSYDSSQLTAIYAAGQSSSFVLHGPPGTGKSQTITNIIAQCLALGKTVLFISEKKVALDVVYSRLTESGLSPFCLELHSDRSNKRDVLYQFEQTLAAHTEKTSDEWSLYAAHLADIRFELNAYFRAMHAVRNTGESIYQGLTKLIGLRNCEFIPLPWDELPHISEKTLEDIERTVHQIELITSENSHPSVHPFFGACCADWSATWAATVEEALETLKNDLDDLLLIFPKLWRLIGCDPDLVSERNIAKPVKLLGLIKTSFLLSGTSLITYPDYDVITDSIHESIEIGRKLNEIRERLIDTYQDSVFTLDLKEINDAIQKIPEIFFLKRRGYTKDIISRIQPHCKYKLNNLDDFFSDIDDISLVNSYTLKLSEKGLILKPVLGPLWNDVNSDWEIIGQALYSSNRIRSLAADISQEPESFPQVLERLHSLVQAIYSDHENKEGNFELLSQYENKLSSFKKSLSNVIAILEFSEPPLLNTSLATDYLNALKSKVSLWLTHKTSLKAWCQWNRIKNISIEKGFARIIEHYETAESHQISFRDHIYRSFYQWWVNSIRDTDPDIKGFFRPQYEDMINDFKESDEALLARTGKEIKARLFSSLNTKMDLRESSEMGILRHQIQMQRRHMPVRNLIRKIHHILPKLKPCLLMSPISVAQYLEPGVVSFDVVIFDEASQIPVSDAIGAISRGKSTIIVGDPKQLPPTDMFRRIESPDPDEYDYCTIELDSILDECIASEIMQKYLSWHYRSRHESLIAFSNYHFYKNSLQTFPSPGKKQVVTLIPIKGIFDSGKTRTNRIEAEVVTDEVIRRLLDPLLRNDSIGIITFNEPQQDLIQEMIESKIRDNYEISELFQTDLSTTLFVKNLENVQGDERDVILFSIGYGPNSEGYVSMNFGPLNRDGGERRLNVAITRARKEVMVFSSLKPEMIDLSRTQKRGVLLLKSFLEYAGYGNLTSSQTCPGYADPQSYQTTSFEEEICSMLRERGYDLTVRVGCSGYRIDIAVIHPEISDYYILGILCDSDTTKTSQSARDRDLLRIKILKDLGWNIHRVWVVDWWDDPTLEISRIEGFIQLLRDEYASEKMMVVHQEEFDEMGAEAETEFSLDESDSSDEIILLEDLKFTREKYVYYINSEILGCPEDILNIGDDDLIVSTISGIIKTEGPVSFDILLERLSKHWQINRKTFSIKEKIKELSERMGFNVTHEGDKIFYWPLELDPIKYLSYRTHDEEEPWKRKSDDIPSIEIQNALRDLLETKAYIQRKELIKKTADLFGFKRVTPLISQKISQSIDILITKEIVKMEGDFILPYSEHDYE